MPYSKQPRSGFTLIEVLVSLTLMAIVATVVLSATRSSFSIWDKANAHIDNIRHSRIILDVLTNQIRGAMPITYTIRKADAGVAVPLAFEGTHTSIRFVSRSSFKDGPDGLPRWVDLQWLRDPAVSSGDLIVEERRILPPDNTADPTLYWRGSLIHAESCGFDFLAAQPGKPPVWVQEWQASVSFILPKAVRLNCFSQGKPIVQSIVPLDYAASSVAGLRLR